VNHIYTILNEDLLVCIRQTKLCACVTATRPAQEYVRDYLVLANIARTLWGSDSKFCCPRSLQNDF